MKLFGKKIKTVEKTEVPSQYAKEILLEKEFKFMYENFIFSSQRRLILLLEEKNGIIESLSFNFKVFKYGYPNDEVGLPSNISGVANYGISEVFNSKWIEELKANNRSHFQHNDSFYSDYKHYVVRFKDVTLEVIAKGFEVEELTNNQFFDEIKKELKYINKVG